MANTPFLHTLIVGNVMTENPLEKIHVLVVEDEKFMRSLICRLLYELKSGKTTDVENGEEGIKALATDAAHVDLILLDIEMPEMDGLEFLQLVRNSEDTLQDKDVPVIMLTGLSEDDKVGQAMKLGIQGYLLKPVSKKTLLTRIVHALK